MNDLQSVYGNAKPLTNMARPKSDDPMIAVQFRMRRSAVLFWQLQADKQGHRLHKEIQRVLEEKAARVTPMSKKSTK